jgi:hypothetical protein
MLRLRGPCPTGLFGSSPSYASLSRHFVPGEMLRPSAIEPPRSESSICTWRIKRCDTGLTSLSGKLLGYKQRTSH